jgi:hypothetical protein
VPCFRLHRSGLFVDNWDKSWAPEIESGIDDVLKTFKPDLVHVHHWIRLSRHLVELFHDRGIPCVATLHDLMDDVPDRLPRARRRTRVIAAQGPRQCHGLRAEGERSGRWGKRRSATILSRPTR